MSPRITRHMPDESRLCKAALALGGRCGRLCQTAPAPAATPGFLASSGALNGRGRHGGPRRHLRQRARWLKSTFCASLSFARCRAKLRRDGDSLLHSRPRQHLIEPTRKMGKLGKSLPLPLPSPRPTDAGHIGDRIRSSEKFVMFKSFVHDAIEAIDLVRIAIDAIVDPVGGIISKVVGLTGHGSETADLPEQPFLDRARVRARWRRRTFRSCGRDIEGSLRTRTLRSTCRPAHWDRRSPGCDCWARSQETQARTVRPCQC